MKLNWWTDDGENPDKIQGDAEFIWKRKNGKL